LRLLREILPQYGHTHFSLDFTEMKNYFYRCNVQSVRLNFQFNKKFLKKEETL